MAHDRAHSTEVCIAETLFKRKGADDSAVKTVLPMSLLSWTLRR